MNERRSAERGSILIFTLWILAILTILALGFGHRTGLETRAISNHLRHLEAVNVARSGVYKAMWYLYFDQKYGGPTDAMRDIWASPMTPPMEDFAAGYLTGQPSANVKVEDEEGKLNLNWASETLLRSGLGDGLAFKVMTWKEGDNPYTSEDDRRFSCLDELLDIPGVMPEEVLPLLDTLTVYPYEANDGRINLNTASLKVLYRIPGMPPSLAENIVAHRPFADVSELATAGYVAQEELSQLSRYLDVRSATFRVVSRASAGGSGLTARVDAVLWRKSGTMPVVLAWKEE